jgi:hydroxymethylglutaryl-CoA lyase
MTMNDIVLHEVGPRDGLQIERTTVPTDRKLAWIRELATAGVDIIQVGSFVNRDKMPQMADTDELFALLSADRPGSVVLSGLVLNEKGLERGFACDVDYFCMGVSASDTHSRKNTGMTTAEATGRIVAMAKRVVDSGKGLQVSVQSAFGCGFEGVVPEQRVLDLVGRFLDAGLRTISLADTAGHAHPSQVEALFGAVQALDPNVETACHFHDTYGMGLANCHAALRVGVRYFETAFAGLGGCPFTAVTGGNVATEDFVHLLRRMNRRPDVDLARLISVASDAGRFFERQMAGKVHRTGPVPLSAQTTSEGRTGV